MPQFSAGSVVRLRRYPVKSMMGEEIDLAEVTERGLAGDRAYALLNVANGKVISAKNPRKWGRMFLCSAAFVEPPSAGRRAPAVRITLPDGRVISSDDGDVEQQLSSALDGTIRLVATPPSQAQVEYVDVLSPGEPVVEFSPAEAAPPGTFFDYAPVHLLTVSTLRRLGALNPAARFEVHRFRPNIVIEADESPDGFVEVDWVGRTLAIGDEVLLKIIDPTPRCVMTTLAQRDLPHEPSVLRTLVDHNRIHVSAFGTALPCAGVYGTVVRGGAIRVGDRVQTE